jgi:hypothetical protein
MDTLDFEPSVAGVFGYESDQLRKVDSRVGLEAVLNVRWDCPDPRVDFG